MSTEKYKSKEPTQKYSLAIPTHKSVTTSKTRSGSQSKRRTLVPGSEPTVTLIKKTLQQKKIEVKNIRNNGQKRITNFMRPETEHLQNSKRKTELKPKLPSMMRQSK